MKSAEVNEEGLKKGNEKLIKSLKTKHKADYWKKKLDEIEAIVKDLEDYSKA